MSKYQKIKGHFIEKLTDVIRVLNPIQHGIVADANVGQFRVDSRQVKPGDVFVAVAGSKADGHRFVDSVLAEGASAALVSSLEGIEQKDRCILVPDTLEALRLLAATHRRSLDVKVIGLTGSVGKTTTKEILAAIMEQVASTRKSEGNYNNTIGLPMEILKLRREERWMIAEMGMSTPGELTELTDLISPDYGLFMAVRAVHLANFANLDQIAQAKAELVNGMRPDACLVYNADDPLVVRYSAPFPGRKVTYGIMSPNADIKARMAAFSDWEGTPFFLSDQDGRVHELFLPMVGRFNVLNAVAASATAMVAGVSALDLKPALARASSAKGRCHLHHLAQEVRLVDDTYNSNPDAVEQVIRSFASLSPRHYRWLLLGDMLELGPGEKDMHRELGRLLAGYGFDRITLVGPLSYHAFEAIQRAKPTDLQVEHFSDTASALESIQVSVPSNARIWCKASRGIGLELLASLLIQQIGSP